MPRRRRPAAFSLIELVLTTLIVGLLAAVAVPRYAAASANYRLDAAARKVAADLAYAPELARSRSGPVTVAFRLETGEVETSYTTDAFSTVTAASTDLGAPPYTVSIESASFGSNAFVIYDGFGRPDAGGAVTLEAGGRKRVITVDAETGEASLP